MLKTLLSFYFIALVVLKPHLAVIAISLPLLTAAISAGAQSILLKDINLQEDVYANEYSALTEGAGKICFINNPQ